VLLDSSMHISLLLVGSDVVRFNNGGFFDRMRKSICLIGGLVTVGSGGFLPLSGLCEQQPTWRFGVLFFLTVIEEG
jgi:hypothetical protein